MGACAESEGRPASAAEREEIQGEPTAALVQLQGGLERGDAAGEDGDELPPHLAALAARRAGRGSGSGDQRSGAAAELPGEGACWPAEPPEAGGAARRSPDPDPSSDPGQGPGAAPPAKRLRSVVARPVAAAEERHVQGEPAAPAAELDDVTPHLARPAAAALAARAPRAAALGDAPPHRQEARAAQGAGGEESYALASGLRVSRAPARGLGAERAPAANPSGGGQSDAGKEFVLASGRLVSRASAEAAGPEPERVPMVHRGRGRPGDASTGDAPASARLLSRASTEASELALEAGSEGVPTASRRGMQADGSAGHEAPGRGRAGNPKPWGGPGNAAVDAVLSRFRRRLTAAGAARVRGAPAAAVPDPLLKPEATAPAAADGRKGSAVGAVSGGKPAEPKRGADAPVQEATEPEQKRQRVGHTAAGEPAAPGQEGAEHLPAQAPPSAAAEGAGAAGGAAPGKPPPAFAVRSLEEIRAERAKRERKRAQAGAAAAGAPEALGGAAGAPGGPAPARQQAVAAAPEHAAPTLAPVLANGGSAGAPALAPRRKRAPIVFAAPPKPAQAAASAPASGAPASAGEPAGASVPDASAPSAAVPDPAEALPGNGQPAGASASSTGASGSAARGAAGAQSLPEPTPRAKPGETAPAASIAAGAATQAASAAAGHADLVQGREGPSGVAGGVPAEAPLALEGPRAAAAAGAEAAAAAGPAGPRWAVRARPAVPAASAKPQYDDKYVKKELIVDAGGEKLEVCQPIRAPHTGSLVPRPCFRRTCMTSRAHAAFASLVQMSLCLCMASRSVCVP